MKLSPENMLKYHCWDLEEKKVTIFGTCKSHQETEATKSLGWRICYAILKDFCGRRLVTWRPLPEPFSSPSWHKIKDQRDLLFSSIPLTLAEQGTECFTKYRAVQGLKGPVLTAWIFVQSSTPRQAVHQMPAKHYRFYVLLAHKYTNIAAG